MKNPIWVSFFYQPSTGAVKTEKKEKEAFLYKKQCVSLEKMKEKE